MQKNETGPLSYTIHKNKFKMDERSKCELGRKILEENIGSDLFDIGHSNFLLDLSPEAKETKAKMNSWNFIKIKSFCTAKETVNKTNRQPTEWERRFTNDTTKG